MYLCGCIALATLMMLLGILALGPQTQALESATPATYLVWFGVWGLTLGPLPHVIIGEVSSMRLRSNKHMYEV